MKKFMITGGLLGFSIGVVFGLAERSEWPSVLWKASVAAFGAGVLLRWWGRLWVKSLEQSHLDRMAKAQTTAPEATAASKL